MRIIAKNSALNPWLVQIKTWNSLFHLFWSWKVCYATRMTGKQVSIINHTWTWKFGVLFMIKIKTRSDIFQGQAPFKRVKQQLTWDKKDRPTKEQTEGLTTKQTEGQIYKQRVERYHRGTIQKNGWYLLIGQNQCHSTGVKKSYFAISFIWNKKVIGEGVGFRGYSKNLVKPWA